MSYCRFENTLRDLQDCYANMDNDDLSKSEFYMRRRMVELCINIVERYDELVNEEFVDEFSEDHIWRPEAE